MVNLIAIFLGGGIGCILRYLISQAIKSLLATFFVNIIGSLILGLIMGLVWEKVSLPNPLKLALCVGFCGGISTFSMFSLECVELIQQEHYMQTVLYACTTVFFCIASVALGIYFAKCISINS